MCYAYKSTILHPVFCEQKTSTPCIIRIRALMFRSSHHASYACASYVPLHPGNLRTSFPTPQPHYTQQGRNRTRTSNLQRNACRGLHKMYVQEGTEAPAGEQQKKKNH
ncbi:unnamed protein product, partial [Ectocarpus sp. 12 AP-2014]